VAATIAVDVVVQRLERLTWSAEQRVREAIALANNEILKQADASPAYVGMTCVLTLAVITDGRVTIGHVGDSRLYKLTPRGISKLTHDHSPIGEREDAREISEVEAMQHPRRNEVFRDVGSAFREPDDPDFIEIVTTTFEPESALLLCSDGLSDMLPSTAIERTVRQHAGDPAAVVSALIAAANEAGGKDNVTVVYVEGPRFAETPRLVAVPIQRRARAQTAAPEPATEDLTEARASGNAGAVVSSIWRTMLESRSAWLAAGVFAGVLLGIGLTIWPGLDPIVATPGRTLTVGTAAQYATIGAALDAARARDVVQVEPGEYEEAVTVKDGVTLTARVPGSVTLVAPAGRSGWVGVSAPGHLGARVSGIRVLGRPAAPIDVGLRLSGHDVSVDDVSVEGSVAVGMEIVNDGAIVVRGSRFTGIKGIPMRIGASARPAVRQNLFVRAPADEDAFGVAIAIAGAAAPQLTGNVFVGFSETLGPAARHELMHGNYSIRGSEGARTERP
jgi:serine/threonine protein phosphatase PrpC